MMQHTTPDDAVRATDVDAAVARVSAAQMGYTDDGFAKYLVDSHLVTSRPPLINIGTHHRTFAIDILVTQFLSTSSSEHCSSKNIVSLGAGSDSRFWRLRQQWHSSGRPWPVSKWLELDFIDTTRRKSLNIQNNSELLKWCYADGVVSNTNIDHGDGFESELLCIQPMDLRSPICDVIRAITTHVPTTEPLLVLAELVFAYVPPNTSFTILSSLSETFGGHGGIGIITYEVLGLGDPFGRVMIENLKARNLTLEGLAANPSLRSQSSRLLKANFQSASAITLTNIRHSIIPPAERLRISKLEFLDEVEELELVLDHYAIAWASRAGTPGDAFWAEFGLRPFKGHGQRAHAGPSS